MHLLCHGQHSLLIGSSRLLIAMTKTKISRLVAEFAFLLLGALHDVVKCGDIR